MMIAFKETISTLGPPTTLGPTGRASSCLRMGEMDEYRAMMSRRHKAWDDAGRPQEAESSAPAFTVANVRTQQRGWSMSEYRKLIDKFVRIRQQKDPTTRRVDIDGDAASMFTSFLQRSEFTMQRVGILYGTVDETNVVRVEAIYEPCQSSHGTGAEEMDDDRGTCHVTRAGHPPPTSGPPS
eukprot:gene7906-7325_t